MDMGVQEHYWMVSDRGPAHEVVYRPYTEGDHFFQSAMALCFLYFVGRLFFNGLVTTLLVGFIVALIMHFLDSVTTTVRPSKHYSRPYYSYF
jgi:hypothetical protein